MQDARRRRSGRGEAVVPLAQRRARAALEEGEETRGRVGGSTSSTGWCTSGSRPPPLDPAVPPSDRAAWRAVARRRRHLVALPEPDDGPAAARRRRRPRSPSTRRRTWPLPRRRTAPTCTPVEPHRARQDRPRCNDRQGRVSQAAHHAAGEALPAVDRGSATPGLECGRVRGKRRRRQGWRDPTPHPGHGGRRLPGHPDCGADAEEHRYHYLWRFWRRLPRDGQLAIFDRSWYGRVLFERVEGYATDDEWQRAYDEINDFELQIAEAGDHSPSSGWPSAPTSSWPGSRHARDAVQAAQDHRRGLPEPGALGRLRDRRRRHGAAHVHRHLPLDPRAGQRQALHAHPVLETVVAGLKPRCPPGRSRKKPSRSDAGTTTQGHSTSTTRPRRPHTTPTTRSAPSRCTSLGVSRPIQPAEPNVALEPRRPATRGGSRTGAPPRTRPRRLRLIPWHRLDVAVVVLAIVMAPWSSRPRHALHGKQRPSCSRSEPCDTDRPDRDGSPSRRRDRDRAGATPSGAAAWARRYRDRLAAHRRARGVDETGRHTSTAARGDMRRL